MSQNNYKNTEEKGKKPENSFLKTVHSVIDGSFLTKEKIIEMLPFFFYLMGLALLLIFNSYYAEKKVREKQELRNEIIELRIRYISTKSELMFITNQSEIARQLEDRGLIESSVPPKVIEKPEKRSNFLLNIFERNTD